MIRSEIISGKAHCVAIKGTVVHSCVVYTTNVYSKLLCRACGNTIVRNEIVNTSIGVGIAYFSGSKHITTQRHIIENLDGRVLRDREVIVDAKVDYHALERALDFFNTALEYDPSCGEAEQWKLKVLKVLESPHEFPSCRSGMYG